MPEGYFYDMNEALHPKAEKLIMDLLTPWKLKFYFWKRLLSLLFWRVKLNHLDAHRSEVSIPFTKRNQNPFRSVYFAAQAGAAEFSTGVLAVSAIEGRAKVSMLVTGMRSEFYKKADSKIIFECIDGQAVYDCVTKAIESNEGQKITLISEGKLASGEVVSKFWLEWSFKVK